MSDISLFALNSGHAFAEEVALRLGGLLGAHEEREFEDGENKLRPLMSVRGKDVYVVQSLHDDPALGVDGMLLRLLFFIGALVDASAERVTAVVPYLCYGRKEQKAQPRDPVISRYIARMFEAVGTHRVVSMDVHNVAAFQNAFRCPTDHLEANPLFVQHFAARVADRPVVVVSPDSGGVKRAERFRVRLGRELGQELPFAFVEKHRTGTTLRGGAIVGDVSGRTAIVIDDLISTGSTMLRAATGCREHGATAVHLAASHGVFADGSESLLANPAIDSVVVTDSIPVTRLSSGPLQSKLVVLGAAPLIADVIEAIHSGGSLTALFGE